MCRGPRIEDTRSQNIEVTRKSSSLNRPYVSSSREVTATSAPSAPLLAEGEHDVTGLDTRFYRGCGFEAELGAVATLDRDIRDVVPAELEGFDAIVHLAALSNYPLGGLDPSLTEEINRDASRSYG